MDSFDDPSEMTPEQRLSELADILANGTETVDFAPKTAAQMPLSRRSGLYMPLVCRKDVAFP
ncbi:MAG: hypothetical protein R3E97_17125 [Candidatus Eisenbacteria bacterium]